MVANFVPSNTRSLKTNVTTNEQEFGGVSANEDMRERYFLAPLLNSRAQDVFFHFKPPIIHPACQTTLRFVHLALLQK